MVKNFISLSLQDQMRIIETIIFASENPISVREIVNILNTNIDFSDLLSTKLDINNISQSDTFLSEFETYILSLIEQINCELKDTNRPYSIIQVAGGYTFATSNRYGKVLSLLQTFKNKKRISRAMLETLTIIAYHQPITKSEIEKIRGVNSGEIINTLLEKGLIQITGRKDTLGKPLLFGTTIEFLKLLGINSLEDLPKLSEISTLIGSQNVDKVIELKINFEDKKNE